RLVGTGQVAFDHVGGAPQLPKRGDELRGRLARLRQRPLVRLRPVISGPEYHDLLRHDEPGLTACFGEPTAHGSTVDPNGNSRARGRRAALPGGNVAKGGGSTENDCGKAKTKTDRETKQT